MGLLLKELKPLAISLVLEEILDSKRFRKNFCDNLLLRLGEFKNEELVSVKRELLGERSAGKFFDGYKAVIMFFLDELIGCVNESFGATEQLMVQRLTNRCKEILERILHSKDFKELEGMEGVVRKEVTLKIVELLKKKSLTNL